MGWLEKGPSASLFVRYVSHWICSSLTPRIRTLLKPTVGLLLMTRCTNLIFVDWTAQRSTRVVLQRAKFDQATQRKAREDQDLEKWQTKQRKSDAPHSQQRFHDEDLISNKRASSGCSRIIGTTLHPRPPGRGIPFLFLSTGAEAPAYSRSASPRRRRFYPPLVPCTSRVGVKSASRSS